jgi:hypothetical protein
VRKRAREREKRARVINDFALYVLFDFFVCVCMYDFGLAISIPAGWVPLLLLLLSCHQLICDLSGTDV